MFSKKKKQNNNTTYVDGVEVDAQTVAKIPELDIPLYPESSEVDYDEFNEEFKEFECGICADYGFYKDEQGVWHHCPRCNPDAKKTSNKIEQVSESEHKEDTAVRICKECKARNLVPKKQKMKSFTCEQCGVKQ